MVVARAPALWIALCSSSFALAACSEILGISGEYRDKPAADAGRRDAGAKGAVDAAGSDDSGASPTNGFCMEHLAQRLCDDFDRMPAVPWSDTSTHGMQMIDGSAYESAPYSFSFVTETLDNRGPAKVARSRSYPATPNSYLLDYALRVDARDPATTAALAAVTIKDNATGYYYSGGIVLQNSGPVFEDVLVPTAGDAEIHRQYPLPQDIELDRWHRFGADVEFASNNVTLTLRIDGKVVMDKVPLQATTPIGQVSLTIGITYLSGPTSAWNLRYDDVLFDFD